MYNVCIYIYMGKESVYYCSIDFTFMWKYFACIHIVCSLLTIKKKEEEDKKGKILRKHS